MTAPTQAEWDKLPLRARMLINAGFVDVDEVMAGWRKHWQEETKMGELQRDAIDKACEEIRCADCALMKACYGNVPYDKRIGCPRYEPKTATEGPRTRNGGR